MSTPAARVLRYSYDWPPFGRLNVAVEKTPHFGWSITQWYDGDQQHGVLTCPPTREACIEKLNHQLGLYRNMWTGLSIDETETP